MINNEGLYASVSWKVSTSRLIALVQWTWRRGEQDWNGKSDFPFNLVVVWIMKILHCLLDPRRSSFTQWVLFYVFILVINCGFFFFFSFIFISWRLITLQYCSGFCHTLTWISHKFTCIPHPDPPSHLPLHPIPLPNAPGPSTCLMHPTWAGDLFHPR